MPQTGSLKFCCNCLNSDPNRDALEDEVVVHKKHQSNYIPEYTSTNQIVIPENDGEGFKGIQDKQSFVCIFVAHSYRKLIQSCFNAILNSCRYGGGR